MVLISPVGYTQIFSFLENQTEMMPDAIAKSSNIMLMSIPLIVVFAKAFLKNKFADLVNFYNITTEISLN
jgi:hypothetical protein